MDTRTTQTIREVATVDNRPVCAVNGSYSEQNCSITVEVMDHAYCDAHKEEVQSFVSAFVSRVNGLTAEYHLPIIKPTEKA